MKIIRIVLSEDGFLGNDSAKIKEIDVPASKGEYVHSLFVELDRAFPFAEISISFDDNPYIEVDGARDSTQCGEVAAIEEDVYNSGEFWRYNA